MGGAASPSSQPSTTEKKIAILHAQLKHVHQSWLVARRDKIFNKSNYKVDAMLRFQIIDLTYHHKRLTSQLAALTEE